MKSKSNSVMLAIGVGLLMTVAMAAPGLLLSRWLYDLPDWLGAPIFLLAVLTLPIVCSAFFLLRMRQRDYLAFVIFVVPAIFFVFGEYYLGTIRGDIFEAFPLDLVGIYIDQFSFSANLLPFLYLLLGAMPPAIVAILLKRLIRRETPFKRLTLRRFFRFCAWGAVALFAILLAVYESINWSGAPRWAAVQAMLAREGESIDIHKIAADPVPDDQNFFAIPLLKDLALCVPNDKTSELGLKLKRLTDAKLPMDMDNTAGPRPNLLQGASLGKGTDLQAWADWFRRDGSLPKRSDSTDPARAVLAVLSRNDALIGELALGLNRPESQWTPPWKTRVLPEDPLTIAVPYYVATQVLTRMLVLRATAAARAGDAAKAHQSLLIAVRLNQAYIQEPLLIGSLVAYEQSALINSTVWELCDAHSGTDEEFRTLQEALSRLDFRASFLSAERGELAAGTSVLEYLKGTKDGSILAALCFDDLLDDPQRPRGSQVMSLLLRAIPGGLYDANAATIAEWDFDYSIKPLRDAGFTALFAKQKEMESLIGDHRIHLYRHLDEIFAQVVVPGVSGVSRKAAYTQSVVNEAIAACALERYRIEHGTYPDTLEAANRPEETSIPLDVISGKPMGYRKTPDGRYALWCVGLTGKDNGGKRILNKENPEWTRFSSPDYPGDWVWDFPGQ